MVSLRLDTEICRHRFRPPCPICKRKTWPTSGLDGQVVFRCFIHGHWTPDSVED